MKQLSAIQFFGSFTLTIFLLGVLYLGMGIYAHKWLVCLLAMIQIVFSYSYLYKHYQIFVKYDEKD